MTDADNAKPNCYQCAHRRNLMGDAHSKCDHPDITQDAITNEPLNQLMAIFAGVGRVDPIVNASGAKHLNVRGNTHGIKGGWFNWPWNFDPIWLETCNGFLHKRECCQGCAHSLVCVTHAGDISSSMSQNKIEKPNCWKDHERGKDSDYAKESR